MELRQMDYAVYGYVYGKEEGFVHYLKGVDGGGLVRPYAVHTADTWKLVEHMMQEYAIELKKEEGAHRCRIYKTLPSYTPDCTNKEEGVGESNLLSLAVCLAILDIFGVKEAYEQEAEETVREYERNRQEAEASLMRLSRRNNW